MNRLSYCQLSAAEPSRLQPLQLEMHGRQCRLSVIHFGRLSFSAHVQATKNHVCFLEFWVGTRLKQRNTAKKGPKTLVALRLQMKQMKLTL